jgi:hypothetical protein
MILIFSDFQSVAHMSSMIFAGMLENETKMKHSPIVLHYIELLAEHI